MVCNLPESINVADLETVLDIFFKDGADEALDITALVPDALELGESSGDDIVHKSALAGRIGLGSNAGGVNLVEGAVFGEGEREEADLIISAGQVRGQFAAEQFCIAARNEYPHLVSEKAVYEQVPAVYVLNLVQEEIGDVGSIKLIHAREDGIKVLCFHPQKSIVVEVDIAVTDAVLQQRFVAKGGLSASPHANHNLGHGAVKFEQRFLPTRHPLRRVVSQYFISLFCKDLQDDSLFNHKLYLYR